MANQKDKGLAWAVAISSTFVMFISQSTFTSYGGIMNSVNMDSATRTWIINVMYSLYFATALLVGPLVRMSTHRKVALIGCLLVTCGFLLTGTQLESPHWLFLTLSSFVGIGLGLAVHSTFLLVTAHFACYRGLAVGIGLLSAGAGNLLSPLIYDWIEGPKDRCNLRALAAAMCFMTISFYMPPPFPSSMSPLSKSKSSHSITSTSSLESKKIRGKQSQQHQTNFNHQNRLGSSGSREKIPLVGADRQRRPSQFMLSIEKTLLPPLEETDAEEESETTQSQASSFLTINSINNNHNNNQNDTAPMDLTIDLKNSANSAAHGNEESPAPSPSSSSADLEIITECDNPVLGSIVEGQKPQPDLVLSSSSSSLKSQNNFDDQRSDNDHSDQQFANKSKRSESVIHIPEKSDTHHFHNSYQPYRKLSLPETSSMPIDRDNNHVATKKRENYEEYRRKIMEMNEKEVKKSDTTTSIRGNSRNNSVVSLVTIKSKTSSIGDGGQSRGKKALLRLKHVIENHLRHFKMIHFSLLKNLKFLNMTIGTLFVILLPNFPLILYAHVLNISQNQNQNGRSFRSLGETIANKIETENNNNNNTNHNILQLESPDSIEMKTNEGDFVLLIIFTLDLLSRFIFSYISDYTFFNRRLGFLCGVFLSTMVIAGIGFVQDIYLIYVLSVTYGIFLGLLVVTESLMFADAFGIDRLASSYGFIGIFKTILILILSSSTALPSPTSSFLYNMFPILHPKANNTIDQLDLFSYTGVNSSSVITTNLMNHSTEDLTKHHQYLLFMLAIPGILCTITWCMELLWVYKLANKFQKKKPSNTINSKDTNTNSSPNV